MLITSFAHRLARKVSFVRRSYVLISLLSYLKCSKKLPQVYSLSFRQMTSKWRNSTGTCTKANWFETTRRTTLLSVTKVALSFKKGPVPPSTSRWLRTAPLRHFSVSCTAPAVPSKPTSILWTFPLVCSCACTLQHSSWTAQSAQLASFSLTTISTVCRWWCGVGIWWCHNDASERSKRWKSWGVKNQMARNQNGFPPEWIQSESVSAQCTVKATQMKIFM